MNSAPVALPPTQDESHAKLLGIFSFVLAGTGFLGLAFILFHYEMMSTVFNNQHLWDQVQAQAAQRHQPAPPFNPQQFFHIFIWFYVVMGGWSLLSIIANLAAGFCLLGFRARTFCLVVAGFNCINLPLGTLLGVFTIVVLIRPSVALRFGAAPVSGSGATAL